MLITWSTLSVLLVLATPVKVPCPCPETKPVVPIHRVVKKAVVAPRVIVIRDTIRVEKPVYVPTYIKSDPIPEKKHSWLARNAFPIIGGVAVGFAICELTNDDDTRYVRVGLGPGYPVYIDNDDDDDNDKDSHKRKHKGRNCR